MSQTYAPVGLLSKCVKDGVGSHLNTASVYSLGTTGSRSVRLDARFEH